MLNGRFKSVLIIAVFFCVTFILFACADSGADGKNSDGDQDQESAENAENADIAADGDLGRCPSGYVWDEAFGMCVTGNTDRCPEGFVYNEALSMCFPESIDGDVDDDIEEELAMPAYGDYDDAEIYELSEDTFDELCNNQAPDYGNEIELAYDCGEKVGTISNYGLGAYEMNDEAIHFIAKKPMKISKVKMMFAHEGKVAVRLTRDLARSNPALDLLLAPEKFRTITASEVNTWVEFDFSADNVKVHPKDHFWVVYRHLDKKPYLALGEICNTVTSHSMYRSDALIAKWRSEGSAFVWGGFADSNFMVRVIGEPFCESTPFFTDISASTAITGLAEETALDSIKFNRLAVADINHDGWQDLLISNSAGVPADEPDNSNYTNRLRVLVSNGDGNFTDFTDASGLNGHFTSLVLAGDVNNDGYVDMFGGVYTDQENPAPGQDKIFLNDGSGVFAVLPNAGVADDATTSAAGFADFDHDGNLDLYVGNWLVKYPNPASRLDYLYMGNGDGTFEDVTEEIGLTERLQYRGNACYGVTMCDWDNDGWMDIFVANYGYDWNYLWHNLAGESFKDEGYNSGLGFSSSDGSEKNSGNTFGIDCGDYNNDGNMDVFLAEIAHPRYQPWSDSSRMLKNLGEDHDFAFEDVTRDLGIYFDEGEIDPTWVDFDNDGDLDLFIASLYPLHFARLYRQEWDGSFSDVTYEAGIDCHDSVANNWIDNDHDGDLDLLVARRSTGSHIHLYENNSTGDNHWLMLRLEGVQSNRSAIGARITVTAGDLTVMREIKGGKGHFNQQPPLRQHFGLGTHDTIDSIKVRWPNGNEVSLPAVAVDGFYYLLEDGNLLADPQIAK